jgi:heptosyltransferase-3
VTPHCLVVHPGALGDVLLARPALVHLRTLGFCTTLAVTSRLVALFARSGLVDQARDLESLALHRLFVEPCGPGVADAIASFDALVCWLGAGDSAFRENLGRLGRPTVVARAIPPPGPGRHVSEHLVETLAPLGPLPERLPSARLGVAEADRATAEAWLGARGIGPTSVVVLQPGAGSSTKVWPGFAALTRRLSDAAVPVVALAGPADDAVVDAILRTGVLTETRVARDWPLPEVAALLSLARGAVGNDSGPIHLAAAVGCPTVAVFGSTDPAVWAPVGPRVSVVAGPRAGAPWPGVDEVEAALGALLGGLGTDAPDAPGLAGATHAWP